MNGTSTPPVDTPSTLGQQAEQPELKPEASGTFYGELSSGKQWFWDGTGKPDDSWIANPKADQPELFAATPGTVIPAATTIDAVFTAIFGTRSADIAATPTYTYSGPFSIIANWPTLQTAQNYGNNSQMMCRFECRQMGTTSIAP